ncbi:Dicarboxylic amino acid permease [Komagataella phaffii CBS 7435]|uniref:Dicarboxylic amino acid permease n=2 Tax=Komagataella phaffii TaxID=460519 RepID=C4R7E9_KOMPG|nr:Dicarboxylic amino acid permease [Komagataella phaffii GS115]AOA65327.1 GQ67_04621T0 [Komagataella phaffii]CAH2451102.1 Dicarboxylic amino acid permease [Komagataella phaffii CBS 7435]AOA69788.1 GQ68_04593T0 [Komagataella phaffii GS115]CAY71524.1 Dicarboxylic amino acid permease [Komagataella phaffii GS115]CCA40867.1 Dicarboxylic amino acid permease [Komagataella phaffii CBS 7435]
MKNFFNSSDSEKHEEKVNDEKVQSISYSQSILSLPDLDPTLSRHASEYEADLSKIQPGVAGEKGHQLKRDLKARHISMIALGGSLGTGLLIGTANSLATAGPGSVFITYSFVGLMVFFVMSALGEMATYIPLAGGFTGYSDRYAHPALGFAVGYSYLAKYLIVTPNQLVAGSLVMQYWVSPEKVNPGVWITIFLVSVVLINLFGVKFFGELEFWLSSLKVITVLGLIIMLFVFMLGGGPDHERLGFRYWTNPGAFAPWKGIASIPKAKFIAFVSSFVYAVFAYSGTELVGVVVAEASRPRRNVPRAIKLTFYRICVFYILSVLLLGCCVAYNDAELVAARAKSTSSSASPFVVAINAQGISGLPHLMNACILIFVFSACNSDLYIATRTLYGLSVQRKAPKILSRTNKTGVPYLSLAVAFCFSCLAYMACSSGSASIFGYFVNVVSIMGLLTWISLLITHICFMNAMKAQGIPRKSLPYRAPFQPYASWITLFFCILVALIKNFTVFLNGFNYKDFITGYIGIPYYFICFFGYKFITGAKRHKSAEVDLLTHKDVIDAEEEEYAFAEAELKAERGNKKDAQWLYDRIFGWIF